MASARNFCLVPRTAPLRGDPRSHLLLLDSSCLRSQLFFGVNPLVLEEGQRALVCVGLRVAKNASAEVQNPRKCDSRLGVIPEILGNCHRTKGMLPCLHRLKYVLSAANLARPKRLEAKLVTVPLGGEAPADPSLPSRPS